MVLEDSKLKQKIEDIGSNEWFFDISVDLENKIIEISHHYDGIIKIHYTKLEFKG